ncbi:MAG TPA: hypothetical protein VGQ64_07920 [Candidatus Limnocylindrales bacterium]|jgi:hypothetical protein|nr:hypothetical protein [Candidatus Limnocylindrales bacterium]
MAIETQRPERGAGPTPAEARRRQAEISRQREAAGKRLAAIEYDQRAGLLRDGVAEDQLRDAKDAVAELDERARRARREVAVADAVDRNRRLPAAVEEMIERTNDEHECFHELLRPSAERLAASARRMTRLRHRTGLAYSKVRSIVDPALSDAGRADLDSRIARALPLHVDPASGMVDSWQPLPPLIVDGLDTGSLADFLRAVVRAALSDEPRLSTRGGPYPGVFAEAVNTLQDALEEASHER